MSRYQRIGHDHEHSEDRGHEQLEEGNGHEQLEEGTTRSVPTLCWTPRLSGPYIMSTHVLSSQILSRYQTERTNRSQMLSLLARQLERFRDVQLSWQEQRMAARAAVSKAQQDIVEKEEEVKYLIREKEDLVKDYKKRLEV